MNRFLKQLFKHDDFTDECIDICEAKIRKGGMNDPAEIGKWLDVREKLLKSKRDNKVRVDWIEILKAAGTVGVEIFKVVTTVALTVYGYQFMANIAMKSYGLDADMVLCNGRVFNMAKDITKLIPKDI